MTKQVHRFLDEMKGDASRRVGYATFYKKNVFKVRYIVNVESLVSNTCCRTNLNGYWRRRSQPLWWLHRRRRKAIVRFQPLPRVSQTTLLSLRVLHRLQPVKSPIVGGVAQQWRDINGAGALLSPVRDITTSPIDLLLLYSGFWTLGYLQFYLTGTYHRWNTSEALSLQTSSTPYPHSRLLSPSPEVEFVSDADNTVTTLLITKSKVIPVQ